MKNLNILNEKKMKKKSSFDQSLFYEINTDGKHRNCIQCIKDGLIFVFNKVPNKHVYGAIQIENSYHSK